MKMETPFTGALAVIGVRGTSGHFLSLRGTWALGENAPVYHRAAGLEGKLPGQTVIGEMKELHSWAGVLYVTGMGTVWLAQMLKSGEYALSMEMRAMKTEGSASLGTLVVTAGTVHAALIVRMADFAWAGKGSAG